MISRDIGLLEWANTYMRDFTVQNCTELLEHIVRFDQGFLQPLYIIGEYVNFTSANEPMEADMYVNELEM